MMWDDDGFPGHSGMMDGGTAVSWLMLLLMIGLVLALIAAVVLMMRRTALTRTPGGTPELGQAPMSDRTPQRILDERLANGDIDEDEYLRRSAALSS